MILVRLDSNPNPDPSEFPDEHRQTEYGVEIIDDYDPESAKLSVAFKRFGRGEHRRPSFAVEVNWIDVKGFLHQYMTLGHPEAAHLMRMIKLAQAVEKAGWSASDEPQDFWEGLLPE